MWACPLGQTSQPQAATLQEPQHGSSHGWKPCGIFVFSVFLCRFRGTKIPQRLTVPTLSGFLFIHVTPSLDSVFVGQDGCSN